MKNKQKALIVSVLIVIVALLTIGGGMYYLFNRPSESEGGKVGLIKANETAITRILASKREPYSIYSIDVNDTSKQNILPYGVAAANENMSKISYVKATDSEISIWKANSDGSDAINIFQTNNTGCNSMLVLGISKDGEAVIFSNRPYAVDEGMYTCKPHSNPSMSEEGLFYIKNGSLPVKIKNFEESSFLGFFEKDILFSLRDARRITSVWKMNIETGQSVKLFDTPKELMWGGYPLVDIDPNTNKAVFNIHSTEREDPANKSEIILFDYKNNTLETIASGQFAEFQGVRPSPNFEKVLYVHEIRNRDRTGIPETEYYVYDVKTKQSTLLELPGKEPKDRISLVWKNNTSFFYILLSGGDNAPRNLKLFDLINLVSGESIGDFVYVGEIINHTLTIH